MSGQSDDNTKFSNLYILFPICGYMIYAFFGIMVKYARETHSTNHIIALRCIGALLTLASISFIRRVSVIPRARLGGHISKSLLNAGNAWSQFEAAYYLTVSSAQALQYTSPIFLVVLSKLIFREKIRNLRYLAIAAGTIGVILVINPDNPASLYASCLILLGSLLGAFSNLFSVSLTKSSSSLQVVTGMYLFAAPFQLWGLDFNSLNIDLPNFFGFLLGSIGVLMHAFLTLSYKHFGASATAPFKYTSLGWAILGDAIIFGTLISTREIIGAVFIALDGILAYLSIIKKRAGN